MSVIIHTGCTIPECGPDDSAVVPEEEGQEDEDVPPLVGVANDVHQSGKEPGTVYIQSLSEVATTSARGQNSRNIR